MGPDTRSERHHDTMTPDEFRRHGAAVVEWIATYLEEVERYPVLSTVSPGDVRRTQPVRAPTEPEEFGTILRDFERDVLPGITHWNHPGFFAYFGISSTGAGILAETLAAALNVNGMLWRTSPAVTELEELALDWLRRMVGLPVDFQGHIQDTASTSTMVALAAARHRADAEVRTRGLCGRDVPRLRVYCSEEAHASVDKAAITLGLGLEGVRRVPTDGSFALRPDALERAIEQDRTAGIRPMAVVATIGTTSTTAVDPIPTIAEIARAHELWLHVDAAYGGAIAVLPEAREMVAGWERADSVVINPHKWLFVPIDCSALFLRDPDSVRRAFAILPEYLRNPEDAAGSNLMELGPALGRRFRALKLWMTIRSLGESGIQTLVREHVRLAGTFADWVRSEREWELACEPRFSTVAFRHVPPALGDAGIDERNARILRRVNASGRVFLSHTRVRGRLLLRLAIGNIGTREEHVALAWSLLREAAALEAD
jgi:aromatic-L-amino-acid/L-tryptophan decarboxylase